jgi:hypothetical protein
MKPEAVAEAVCRMAEDFHRLRDRSMLDLLKASGYLQAHDSITEQHLHAIFDANPDLIRPWLAVENGGRYGYYLLPPGTSDKHSDWVVGHNPRGKEEHFQDERAAWARFVKFKVEDWRYMIEGGPPIRRRQ